MRKIILSILSVFAMAGAAIAGSFYDSPNISTPSSMANMGLAGNFQFYSSTIPGQRNIAMVLSSTGGIRTVYGINAATMTLSGNLNGTNGIFSGWINASSITVSGLVSFGSLSISSLSVSSFYVGGSSVVTVSGSTQTKQGGLNILSSFGVGTTTPTSLAEILGGSLTIRGTNAGARIAGPLRADSIFSVDGSGIFNLSTGNLANASDVSNATASLKSSLNSFVNFLSTTNSSINNLNISTASITGRITNLEVSTQALLSNDNFLKTVASTTSVFVAGLSNSTDTLQARITLLNIMAGTVTIAINNLNASTATIQVQVSSFSNLASSDSQRINALSISTATLNQRISGVGVVFSSNTSLLSSTNIWTAFQNHTQGIQASSFTSLSTVRSVSGGFIFPDGTVQNSAANTSQSSTNTWTAGQFFGWIQVTSMTANGRVTSSTGGFVFPDSSIQVSAANDYTLQPKAGSTNYIQIGNVLQVGATFYVSSGTALTLNAPNIFSSSISVSAVDVGNWDAVVFKNSFIYNNVFLRSPAMRFIGNFDADLSPSIRNQSSSMTIALIPDADTTTLDSSDFRLGISDYGTSNSTPTEIFSFGQRGGFGIKNSAINSNRTQLFAIGTTSVSVLMNGNVGLGTASPVDRFDVFGGSASVRGGGARLMVEGMIQTSSGGIMFPDGSIQTSAGSGGSTSAIVNVASTYTWSAAQNFSSMTFTTGTGSSMTLTTALFVQGLVKVASQGIQFPDGSIQITSATLVAGTDQITNSTLTWNASQNFSSATVNGQFKVIGGSVVITGSNNGLVVDGLIISTGGYRSKDIVLMGDGTARVGIGTLVPSGMIDIYPPSQNYTTYLLGRDVNGAARISMTANLPTGAGNIVIYNASSQTAVQLSGDASTPMFFNNGNKVAIGTTTPSSLLDIVGGSVTIRGAGGGLMVNGVVRSTVGFIYPDGTMQTTASSGTFFSASTSYTWTAAQNFSTVYVGTNNFTPGTARMYVASNLQSNQPTLKVGDYNTGMAFHTFNPDRIANEIRVYNDENLNLITSGAGKIGIGTSYPSSFLDVNNGSLTVRGTNAGILAMGPIQSKSGGFIFPDGTTQTTASSGSAVNTASTLTWTASQNFSSGTFNTLGIIALDGLFTVGGGSITLGTSPHAISILRDQSTSFNGSLYLGGNGNESGAVGISGSNNSNLYIHNKGGNGGVFIGAASGNVGIGTTGSAGTGPFSKLDVFGGSITLRGNNTQGIVAEGPIKTFSGFVFPDSTTQTTAFVASTGANVSSTNTWTAAQTFSTATFVTIRISSAIIWPDGTVQITSPIAGSGSGGGSVSLPFPAGATNYIQNSDLLQNATFYVSSGTANSFNANNAVIYSKLGVGVSSTSSTLYVSGASVTFFSQTALGTGHILGLQSQSGNAGMDITPTNMNGDALINFNQAKFTRWQFISAASDSGLLNGFEITAGTGTSDIIDLSQNGTIRLGANNTIVKLAQSTVSVAGNMSVGVNFATANGPQNGLAVQGNVGIGTANPTSIFDILNGSVTVRGAGAAMIVHGVIKSTAGFVFPDGTVQITSASSGGGSVSLPFPAGATNYIQNSDLLQNATFYVSSGTVAGTLYARDFVTLANSSNPIIGFDLRNNYVGNGNNWADSPYFKFTAKYSTSSAFGTAIESSMTLVLTADAIGNPGTSDFRLGIFGNASLASGLSDITSRKELFSFGQKGGFAIKYPSMNNSFPSNLFMVGQSSFTISREGNVGIGTANPSATFEIKNGSVAIRSGGIIFPDNTIQITSAPTGTFLNLGATNTWTAAQTFSTATFTGMLSFSSVSAGNVLQWYQLNFSNIPLVGNIVTIGANGQFTAASTVTAAILSSTQTFTGANTFTSSFTITSGTVSIAGVNYVFQSTVPTGTNPQILYRNPISSNTFWGGVPSASGGGSGDAVLAGTQTWTGQNTFNGLVTVSSVAVFNYRVGIGSSAPGYDLVVSSSKNDGTNLRMTNGVNDSEAYVGISMVAGGSNPPSLGIEVVPSNNTNVALQNYAAAVGFEAGDGASNGLIFTAVNTGAPIVFRSGGRTSSANRLVIAASGNLSAGGNMTANVFQTSGGGSCSSPDLSSNGDTDTGIAFLGAERTILCSNGVENLRVNQGVTLISGNLLVTGITGIGTGSPSSQLDVVGGSITVRGAGAGLIVRNGTMTVTGDNGFAAINIGSSTITIPPSAGYAQIYSSASVGGTTEIWVQDSAGNRTQISPHNENGEWQYFSVNSKTGKVVRINMEEMIADVEKLTGKRYIYDK